MDIRWRVLFLLFLSRTSMAYQFQSVASAGAVLVEQLGLGYAEIGTLIGLYMLPGIAFALPGGLLTARFGDRRIATLGLGLMTLGGLGMGLAEGPAMLFAMRIVSGIGGVFFNLVVMKMATDWFAHREIALAMGCVMASWPCGIGLGLLTQPAVAVAYGWGPVFIAAALPCAVATLLVATLYRDPPSAAALALARTRLSPGEIVPTTIAAVLWGAFNVALVVFFSFTPPLLAEQGMSLVEAASATSVGLWTSMLSLPLGGLVVTWIGRPDLSIVVFTLLTGGAAALLPGATAPLLLCLAYGIFIGPPASAIMGLPARALAPAHRATGFGVFYTVYYALMAAGPALAGLLQDRWQTAAAPTLYGALLLLASPALLALFRAVLPRAAAVTSPQRAP
jgi:MFS family permease